jgi:hypothetical protein
MIPEKVYKTFADLVHARAPALWWEKCRITLGAYQRDKSVGSDIKVTLLDKTFDISWLPRSWHGNRVIIEC